MAKVDVTCLWFQEEMEGLEIPEELRAKLMAHLGVSGMKSFFKIL